MDRAGPRRDDINLAPESLPISRAMVLVALVLLPACAKPAPAAAPVASQWACPDNLPDVDRLACRVSESPGAAPDARKPALLLRSPDGSAVIGPKPSQ